MKKAKYDSPRKQIGVAGCLLSLVEGVCNGIEPTYGAYQGRLDQELILALRMLSGVDKHCLLDQQSLQ